MHVQSNVIWCNLCIFHIIKLWNGYSAYKDGNHQRRIQGKGAGGGPRPPQIFELNYSFDATAHVIYKVFNFSPPSNVSYS